MQFVYHPEYHTPGRNIQLLRKNTPFPAVPWQICWARMTSF